jgi:hypothetical protein
VNYPLRHTGTLHVQSVLDQSQMAQSPELSLPPSIGMKDPRTGAVFHVAGPAHVVTNAG